VVAAGGEPMDFDRKQRGGSRFPGRRAPLIPVYGSEL
jgi:hypothetical protein